LNSNNPNTQVQINDVLSSKTLMNTDLSQSNNSMVFTSKSGNNNFNNTEYHQNMHTNQYNSTQGSQYSANANTLTTNDLNDNNSNNNYNNNSNANPNMNPTIMTKSVTVERSVGNSSIDNSSILQPNNSPIAMPVPGRQRENSMTMVGSKLDTDEKINSVAVSPGNDIVIRPLQPGAVDDKRKVE